MSLGDRETETLTLRHCTFELLVVLYLPCFVSFFLSFPTTTARDTVGANLKQKWAKLAGSDKELSPEEKWKQLLQHLRVKFDLQDDNENSSHPNKRPKLSTIIPEKQRVALWPMEVVFENTYPRLRSGNSKLVQHFLWRSKPV